MVAVNSSGLNESDGRSAIDDPLSPYFLHHSDNPGLVLVSQPLTGDNYASWSRAMNIALSVKNKLGFIDGSIPKPSASELVLLSAWTRNNNIVISWILNSVSKEISASILFAESAIDIWTDLKDRFQQSNGPRVFQLRRDLVNLRQEQDPVSVYFTKLKGLWEELNNFHPMCNCGKCSCEGVKKLDDYFQMDYTMTFLMGLHDSFAQVRSQILLLDPLPPINRVFSLVVQEERQRAIGSQFSGNNSQSGMAFALKSEQSQKVQNNRGPQKFQKDRPYCTSCQIHGHTIETCYKIHGYPPGYKHRAKSSNRTSSAPVNQASGPNVFSDGHSIIDTNSSNILQSLDKGQMDQLMVMFVQHLSAYDKRDLSQDSSSTSNVTGASNREDDWQG